MKTLAIAIAAVLCVGMAQAQKGQRTQWELSAFDATASKLPFNFQGHECRRLVAAIQSAKLKKDQYETTEAFAKRLDDVKSKPVLGSLTVVDQLALLRRSRLEPETSYDADKQVLRVRVSVNGRGTFINGRSYTMDSLELHRSKTSSYIGSNAYGATRRVAKTESTSCFVAFPSPLFDVRNPLVVEIPDIGPDQARRLNGKVDVVYVGKLSEPYVSEVFDHHAATIDYPSEITVTGDTLVITLDAIWVINHTTGEVLNKMTF